MPANKPGRSHTRALFIASLLATTIASAAAYAQSTTPGSPAAGAVNSGVSLGPSLGVSTPLPPGTSVPPIPSPEALLPGIFGLGPILRDHGVAVLLDDVDEFDGIISGPRQGAANAGQYGLEVDIDWERLAGLIGFSTHVVTVGRYGIPASRIFGDETNPSQEIYGAGGNVVNHLVFAYGEETLAGGKLDIQAGRMPLLNDYLASPLYCNFQNNAFCGNPKESSDNYANSSYPDANWAFNVRVRPIDPFYLQTGIYFTQSNIYSVADNFRSGWTIDASYISGEAFPVEVGWEPAFGPDHLPGHYKVGFIYDNNSHRDQVTNAPGLTALDGKGSTTAYALADQMLMRNGPGDTNGLISFAAYTHNDPKVNPEENEFELAFLDRGFWKARQQDTLGLAFNYTEFSGSLVRAEEISQEFGFLPQPTPDKISSEVGATGIQTHTFNIELNYQIHVYRGVTIAPDFQYFIRPNGQGNLPDAALLGFKSHVELF